MLINFDLAKMDESHILLNNYAIYINMIPACVRIVSGIKTQSKARKRLWLRCGKVYGADPYSLDSVRRFPLHRYYGTVHEQQS